MGVARIFQRGVTLCPSESTHQIVMLFYNVPPKNDRGIAFSFCREVNSFAVTVVGHRTKQPSEPSRISLLCKTGKYQVRSSPI